MNEELYKVCLEKASEIKKQMKDFDFGEAHLGNFTPFHRVFYAQFYHEERLYSISIRYAYYNSILINRVSYFNKIAEYAKDHPEFSNSYIGNTIGDDNIEIYSRIPEDISKEVIAKSIYVLLGDEIIPIANDKVVEELADELLPIITEFYNEKDLYMKDILSLKTPLRWNYKSHGMIKSGSISFDPVTHDIGIVTVICRKKTGLNNAYVFRKSAYGEKDLCKKEDLIKAILESIGYARVQTEASANLNIKEFETHCTENSDNG